MAPPKQQGQRPRRSTPKTSPYAPMRPAHDVYARIAHDAERFDPADVVIGYEDRHAGIMEIAFAQWKRETSDDEFVPMHRVRYFRRAGGEMLWDRRERRDWVFGGGGGGAG